MNIQVGFVGRQSRQQCRKGPGRGTTKCCHKGSPECNFTGKKAHFYQATLIEANFDEVDIAGVNFSTTNLSKADFSKAINAEKADFDGACGDDKTKFPPSQKITLTQCPKQE